MPEGPPAIVPGARPAADLDHLVYRYQTVGRRTLEGYGRTGFAPEATSMPTETWRVWNRSVGWWAQPHRAKSAASICYLRRAESDEAVVCFRRVGGTTHDLLGHVVVGPAATLTAALALRLHTWDWTARAHVDPWLLPDPEHMPPLTYDDLLAGAVTVDRMNAAVVEPAIRDPLVGAVAAALWHGLTGDLHRTLLLPNLLPAQTHAVLWGLVGVLGRVDPREMLGAVTFSLSQRELPTEPDTLSARFVCDHSTVRPRGDGIRVDAAWRDSHVRSVVVATELVDDWLAGRPGSWPPLDAENHRGVEQWRTAVLDDREFAAARLSISPAPPADPTSRAPVSPDPTPPRPPIGQSPVGDPRLPPASEPASEGVAERVTRPPGGVDDPRRPIETSASTHAPPRADAEPSAGAVAAGASGSSGSPSGGFEGRGSKDDGSEDDGSDLVGSHAGGSVVGGSGDSTGPDLAPIPASASAGGDPPTGDGRWARAGEGDGDPSRSRVAGAGADSGAGSRPRRSHPVDVTDDQYRLRYRTGTSPAGQPGAAPVDQFRSPGSTAGTPPSWPAPGQPAPGVPPAPPAPPWEDPSRRRGPSPSAPGFVPDTSPHHPRETHGPAEGGEPPDEPRSPEPPGGKGQGPGSAPRRRRSLRRGGGTRYHTPASAHTGSPATEPSGPRKNRRRTWGLVAVVGVLLLASMIGSFVLTRDHEGAPARLIVVRDGVGVPLGTIPVETDAADERIPRIFTAAAVATAFTHPSLQTIDTSLSPAVQTRAENALTDTERSGAIVVVNIGNGAVRAVAETDAGLAYTAPREAPGLLPLIAAAGSAPAAREGEGDGARNLTCPDDGDPTRNNPRPDWDGCREELRGLRDTAPTAFEPWCRFGLGVADQALDGVPLVRSRLEPAPICGSPITWDGGYVLRTTALHQAMLMAAVAGRATDQREPFCPRLIVKPPGSGLRTGDPTTGVVDPCLDRSVIDPRAAQMIIDGVKRLDDGTARNFGILTTVSGAGRDEVSWSIGFNQEIAVAVTLAGGSRDHDSALRRESSAAARAALGGD